MTGVATSRGAGRGAGGEGGSSTYLTGPFFDDIFGGKDLRQSLHGGRRVAGRCTRCAQLDRDSARRVERAGCPGGE